MKIRADEHVSERIVRIVCDLAASPKIELSSVYGAGQRGSKDQHWITEFANEGGKAIVSADTDFFKKHHQMVAIFKTGLSVFYLPPKWANAACHLQAAHVLMWWGRVEEKMNELKPLEVWVAKWNVNDTGALERRKVDYAEHFKKAKKANRRSG